ncbi:MAG: hypothetical protein U0165_20565, partial [Polyangiaceae bacterium]
LRPLFKYPDFRKFIQLALDRFGPGGKHEEVFQRLLATAEGELRAIQADPAVPPLQIDTAKFQPNRPRGILEILSGLMLAQDDAFAISGGATPRYIAARDFRGFAMVEGSTPGIAGVPAPFFDSDGDGLPDVDLLGRYVASDGKPIFAAPPFKAPDAVFDSAWTFDDTHRAQRDGVLVYKYVDTSRALLGRMSLDLQPLAATRGTADAPAPSSLMKALEGAYALAGVRKSSASKAFGVSSGPGGKNGAPDVFYTGFDPKTSPLVDVTHAVGQILGSPGSDDYLGYMLQLHEQHPELTAKAVSLAFNIWDKGKTYPNATLKDESVFWDEFTEWLVRVARIDASRFSGVANPGETPRGLLKDVLLAASTPQARQWLPKAYAPAFLNKDNVNYNPGAINGPPLNKSTGNLFGDNPFQTPVNRSQSDASYDNRSVFQRFIQLIAETNHVKTCNKYNAKIRVSTDLPCTQGFLGPIINFIVGDYIELPLDIDPFNDPAPIDECGLFEIEELAVFFVDSLLPQGHPRKAKIRVLDQGLNDLLNTLQSLAPGLVSACGLDVDNVFTNSSGLSGLTSSAPTAGALSRLVYFDAQTDAFPSAPLDSLIDTTNKQTNLFISGVMDPVGTNLCTPDAKGVNSCSSFDQTLRGRIPGGIFYFEAPYIASGSDGNPTSGFYEGMKPILTAFANYSFPGTYPGNACPKDPDTNACKIGIDQNTGQCLCPGELLFTDLIEILNKHWPQDASALSRYEELLAWIFGSSGILETGKELTDTFQTMDYTSPRVKNGAKRDGLDVSLDLLQLLLDPKVAESLNFVDAKGNNEGKRNDGSSRAVGERHITPYDMLVAALRGMDKRFDDIGDPDKKARWKEARGELVDQFVLAQNNQWVNPAIAKAIPILGNIAREHVNAHCSDRETTKQCDWARSSLSKQPDVMERPLFSAVLDFNEALRGDDEARIEIEKLVTYLITENNNDPELLAATLSSLGDIMQVLQDDTNLSPILNAFAEGAVPRLRYGEDGTATEQDKVGAASKSLELLRTLLDDHNDLPAAKADEVSIDRYHLLDVALRNAVTPLGDGKLTPIEVILDTIADINRIDSSVEGSLEAKDYAAVSTGVVDFLTDPYRGLDQFYTIVCTRDGGSATDCLCRVHGLVDSQGNVDATKCSAYLKENLGKGN